MLLQLYLLSIQILVFVGLESVTKIAFELSWDNCKHDTESLIVFNCVAPRGMKASRMTMMVAAGVPSLPFKS